MAVVEDPAAKKQARSAPVSGFASGFVLASGLVSPSGKEPLWVSGMVPLEIYGAVLGSDICGCDRLDPCNTHCFHCRET